MSADLEIQQKTKKRNGFTQQPNCIYQVPSLKTIEKLLWQYLNSHSEKFNPSINVICENCGCSRQTAISAIKKLKSMNMLSVENCHKGLTNKYKTQKDTSKWYPQPSLNKTLPQSKSSTTPSLNKTLPPVSNLDPKNTKENNNKNTNVEGTPVDNSEPTKKGKNMIDDNYMDNDCFKEIMEVVNELHPWCEKKLAGRIAGYYCSLAKKNPEGTIRLLDKYLKGLSMGSELGKSIRMNNGRIVFDTAFKIEFERNLKHE